MTRRGFIGRTLSCGALFAVSRLPSFADERTVFPARGDHLRQLNDPVTRGFIAHLQAQPLLKAILAGHLHIGVEERFSPTAMQYVVAGNYMFHAAEILIT